MVKYEGDKDMPRNTNLDFIKCIACIGVVGLHRVGMIYFYSPSYSINWNYRILETGWVIVS